MCKNKNQDRVNLIPESKKNLEHDTPLSIADIQSLDQDLLYWGHWHSVSWPSGTGIQVEVEQHRKGGEDEDESNYVNDVDHATEDGITRITGQSKDRCYIDDDVAG